MIMRWSTVDQQPPAKINLFDIIGTAEGKAPDTDAIYAKQKMMLAQQYVQSFLSGFSG